MKQPKGVRYGGRAKGTPNKTSLEIADKLAALGCDPLEGMAQLAQDPKTPIEVRGRMLSELAQYVAPKRKAIEHSGQIMIEPIKAKD